ncbi:MAG: transposase [Muribaculaceae bacterium]|nr:transposase [Muribaculaceae bacterium]
MRSFSCIYIMAVFGTKYRLGLISEKWRDELYAVMGQILKDIDGVRPIKIGGVNDHVHVLFSTRGLIPEAEIVRKLKSESSLWINSRKLTVGKFGWQEGGARISYSYSALDSVKRYIDNQKEHHRIHTFREEYERLMMNLGMKYDKYDLPEDPI